MRVLRERLAHRNDAGFTLAEVMVALLIFALMSIGTIHAALSIFDITYDARARQSAANLAAQEIDQVRSVTDVMTLVDNSYDQVVNGVTFHLVRTSRWVPASGSTSNACGASSAGATLRYKEIAVSVTWDSMRTTTDPVRSNTLINPRQPVVDAALGTILVTVLGADGTGRAGVAVTASGASNVSATTDSQGCAYLLKVTPGSYSVAVSRSGYVDQDQDATPLSSTSVTAGSSAALQFQYDKSATFALTYASGYTPTPDVTKVRTLPNLPVTFASTYGLLAQTPTSASTAMTRSFSLHPFSSGYTVFAGDTSTCPAADPAAWPADPATAPMLVPAAATPGSSVSVGVPMGVVVLNLTGSAKELRAVPQSGAVAGDPGCTGAAISFGTSSIYRVGPGKVAVALPYGSWKLTWGGAAVTAAQMTAVGMPTRTTIAANGTVTFDPRTP